MRLLMQARSGTSEADFRTAATTKVGSIGQCGGSYCRRPDSVSGCFSPTTFVILTNRKWQLYRLSFYGSGSRSSSDHASSSLAGVHRAFAGLVLGRRRIRTGLPHIFRSGPISADLQAVATRSVAANLQSAAVAMASSARLRPVAAELQSAADKDRYLSKPLAAALPFRAIVLIDG